MFMPGFVFPDGQRLTGLRPRRTRSLRRGRGLALLAIRLLPSLADVNATFEERAIFNRDARRNYVAGERAIAADIHAIAGGEIATHFAQHHDFSRIDIGGNYAIASYRDTVTCQIDGTFHTSVNVKRLGASYFALDHE